MILRKAFRLSIAFGLGILLGNKGDFHIATASAGEGIPASEADLTYFYRNPSPERVARLVDYFNRFTLSNRPYPEPTAIGFLAAAFQRYPNDIDAMIPTEISPITRGTVAIALQMAGQGDKARMQANLLQASGASIPDLRHVPASIDAIGLPGRFAGK